jgi:hypothetical protein
LSKKLKKENNYILVDLMRAFMMSQERPFIPKLIQEILIFKSWVLGCFKDGLESLVGHIDMHLFGFFVDFSGWPMMNYKVSLTDLVWSLIDAPLIRLWNVNPDGHPKLPTRVPSDVPFCIIWGNDV